MSLEQTDNTEQVKKSSDASAMVMKDAEKKGSVRAKEKVSSLVHAWNAKPKDQQTYDGHDELVRQLYSLYVDEPSSLGKDVYVQAIRKEEEMMRTQWKNQMPSILRNRVQSMRETMARETTSNAERILPVLTKMEVDASRFATKNGKLSYKLKTGDTFSEWTVSLNDAETVIMRNRTNPSAMLAMNLQEFISALEKKNLDSLLSVSLKDAESEKKGEATLRNYDLPTEGQMAHIRLFPKNSRDEVAKANLSSAAFLSSAMQQRYGQRLQVVPIQFTDNPIPYLRELIADGYQNGKGIQTYIIDIYQHGTREHIDFDTPLTASDLATLARDFPNCRFQINTIACFGGGLRSGFEKEFKKDPQLAKRMQIFLQTKPQLSNYLGKIQNENGAQQWSTVYNAHLALALSEGKTFGEAAAFADKATKEFAPQDAEALIDGKLITADVPQEEKTTT